MTILFLFKKPTPVSALIHAATMVYTFCSQRIIFIILYLFRKMLEFFFDLIKENQQVDLFKFTSEIGYEITYNFSYYSKLLSLEMKQENKYLDKNSTKFLE